MKKVLVFVTVLFVMILLTTIVWATEQNKTEINTTNKETTSEIIEQKEDAQSKMDKYIEDYGSETYGMVAYVLNIISIYSIPFCFVGIAIGATYQYAIGTRRLDMKQKGFALILSFVTILVICQVLPLIFLVVVKGWRG